MKNETTPSVKWLLGPAEWNIFYSVNAFYMQTLELHYDLIDFLGTSSKVSYASKSSALAFHFKQRFYIALNLVVDSMEAVYNIMPQKSQQPPREL